MQGVGICQQSRTFAGRGRIPHQKGDRGILVPRLVISMDIQQVQLHFFSKFSCKLLTSILVEKGYVVKTIVNDPLHHPGESTSVSSDFWMFNATEVYFLSLAPPRWGVESDPIVSVSTVLLEQCSLIGAKSGSSSDIPADEEQLKCGILKSCWDNCTFAL